MATEIQYKVFRASYDEENTRYSHLENRAKLYLTIITFYLGAVAFKITDIASFASQFRIPITLYLVMALLLLVALLLTILATRIRTYEGVNDLENIVKSLGAVGPTDEEFLDSCLIDLAVATNRNARINNKVASVLQWASYLLFLAVVCQLTIFLWAMLNAGG
jgi:hypothetical protein